MFLKNNHRLSIVHSYPSTSCRSTSSSTTHHLTHQSLSFFERVLRLPSTFPLASLAYSNPCTRLKKGSWRSFSRSHDLAPNLHLDRQPLIPCPPNPPWSTPSTYTISLHLSSPCSHKDPPSFATPQLPPIFPPYLTAISLPGLTARYLAGWCRDTHQVFKVCLCYLALLLEWSLGYHLQCRNFRYRTCS